MKTNEPKFERRASEPEVEATAPEPLPPIEPAPPVEPPVDPVNLTYFHCNHISLN